MRRLVFLAFLFLALRTVAPAAPAPGQYDRVDVAPTWTSVYVGTVRMRMPTFVRHGGTYTAPYSATVFPFFFYSEKGVLTVAISAAQLADLTHGKPIDFSGKAVRSDGAIRRVTGRATPKNAIQGALKVRVYVTKRIDLVFHTTYRFPDAARAPAGGK